jgi:hypothetical protein
MTVDSVAFRFPAELKVVVAVDEAVLDSSPVGIGDPLAQGCTFDAVTEPPDPVPVE